MLTLLVFVRSLFGALLLSAAVTLHASEEPPTITEEGLVLIRDSRFALVYAEPDADLSGYDSIMATDTTVAFRKNYRREQNRNSAVGVSGNDMERSKRGR